MRFYGHGFVGQGEYSLTDSGKRTNAGKSWIGILQRCYATPDSEYTLSDSWKDFQVFAKWYYENHIDGAFVATSTGQYSPESCRFSLADEVHQPQVQPPQVGDYKYSFKDPQGNIHQTNNLKGWCRDNGKRYSKMMALHKGRKDIHTGWTRY